MSKKTRFTLGRITVAAALFTATSLTSAATCSTSYCFVDGNFKWSTSDSIEDLYSLFGVSISTSSGNTTKIENNKLIDYGDGDFFYTHIVTIPATNVKFLNPDFISLASMQGSELIFTRRKNSTSNYTVSLKNLSVNLSAAPTIVPIYSDFQGANILKPKLKTFWNLEGSGSFAISDDQGDSHTTGTGYIGNTKESDGYHHLRLHIPAFSLLGINISSQQSQKPYATDSLNDFWSELGINSAVWYEALQSRGFGSIDLDLRFLPVNH